MFVLVALFYCVLLGASLFNCFCTQVASFAQQRHLHASVFAPYVYVESIERLWFAFDSHAEAMKGFLAKV